MPTVLRKGYREFERVLRDMERLRLILGMGRNNAPEKEAGP